MALPSKKNVSSEVKVIFPPVTVVPGAAPRPIWVPFPELETQMFLPSGAVSTKR